MEHYCAHDCTYLGISLSLPHREYPFGVGINAYLPLVASTYFTRHGRWSRSPLSSITKLSHTSVALDWAHDSAGEDHWEQQEHGHHDGDRPEQLTVLLDEVRHLVKTAIRGGTAWLRLLGVVTWAVNPTAPELKTDQWWGWGGILGPIGVVLDSCFSD